MAHAASAEGDDHLAAYYARRAETYERIYRKPERQADLRAIESALPAHFGGRDVIELACGTGWWTRFGARDASAWLATDLNPETMAIARAKAMPAAVQFATVDAWTFAPLGDREFDAAFAGCWWSHVPLPRLPGWLALLHQRLRPGARVVMLDNLYVPGSSTPLSRRDGEGNTYQTRALDDGTRHEVLKNFPTREQAFDALGARATHLQWTAHRHYWVLAYTLN